MWTDDELLERAKRLDAAMKRHEETEELSPSEYRLHMRFMLSRLLRTRLRVYLDTAYWVRLRDCELGRPRSKQDEALYSLLARAVKQRLVAVPVTEPLLRETLRQNVGTTRAATAAVVDRISYNVALAGARARAIHEVNDWYSALAGEESVGNDFFYWTWAAHLFGEMRPKVTMDDENLAARLEKAIEDEMATTPFSSIVEQLYRDETEFDDSWARMAEENNRLKQTVWDPAMSFSEVFLEECQGYWNSMWPFFMEHAENILRKAPFLKGSETEEQLFDHTSRLLIASIQLDQLGVFLPGMQIHAGANAAIRTQQGRQFKPGDAEDHYHAIAALPHCDIFATDRSSRHLLTTKPLELDRRFQCQVVASSEELVESLEQRLTANANKATPTDAEARLRQRAGTTE